MNFQEWPVAEIPIPNNAHLRKNWFLSFGLIFWMARLFQQNGRKAAISLQMHLAIQTFSQGGHVETKRFSVLCALKNVTDLDSEGGAMLKQPTMLLKGDR